MSKTGKHNKTKWFYYMFFKIYNSSHQTKAMVGVMRGQQTELLNATNESAKTNTKTNVGKMQSRFQGK